MNEENISEMNVFQKLSAVRDEVSHLAIKKSGINQHAEFTYFELEDIVPIAEPLFSKYHLFYHFTIENGQALGTLINIDDAEHSIRFTAPFVSIAEPAKYRMNETQALGAAITYMRRYMLFIVLDLVEHDAFDASVPLESADNSPKKKPVSSEERKEIKNNITAPNAQADEIQVKGLKNALKALLDIDNSQEDFVQSVVVKTKSFTSISKSECEELIKNVQAMLGAYEG